VEHWCRVVGGTHARAIEKTRSWCSLRCEIKLEYCATRETICGNTYASGCIILILSGPRPYALPAFFRWEFFPVDAAAIVAAIPPVALAWLRCVEDALLPPLSSVEASASPARVAEIVIWRSA
jgi:hypothetical protein